MDRHPDLGLEVHHHLDPEKDLEKDLEGGRSALGKDLLEDLRGRHLDPDLEGRPDLVKVDHRVHERERVHHRNHRQ